MEASHDLQPALVRWSVALWEQQPEIPKQAVERILELSEHDDVRVRFQVALTLGNVNDPHVGKVLLALASRPDADRWLRAAVMSSARQHAREMLNALLTDKDSVATQQDTLKNLIATTLGDDVASRIGDVVKAITKPGNDGSIEKWQTTALASCVDALQRRNMSWAEIAQSNPAIADAAQPLFAAARHLARNDQVIISDRQLAIRLLGHEPEHQEEDDEFLYELLTPHIALDLQVSALHALADRQIPGLAEQLVVNWKHFSPKLRPVVSMILLSRDEWGWKFLEAIESGEVPDVDVGAITRARLLQNLNFEMRIVAHRIFGESEQTDRQRVIDAYSEARTLAGQISRGRKVLSASAPPAIATAGWALTTVPNSWR